MMKTPHFIFAIAIPLLFSCQSNNISLPTHTELSSNLFLDNNFNVSDTFHVETEEQIFQLDDEMIAMVKAKLINNHTAHYKARILLDHLFNEESISLQYNGNANVTASEAYHSQTANCMSLTIMAYALAHEAGITVNFQQVNVPEYWVRNGEHSFLTGHVNLVVRNDADIEQHTVWGEKATQIDFDPYVAKQHFTKKTVKKNTVLAMFYNNKGADALIVQNYAIAYQYFKAAISQDESFSSAWGNLAVLYKFTQHNKMAEKVYRHTLMLNKNNLTALTNLALLLKDQNRQEEALRIDNYLSQVRKMNPYYYALLADEAFYQAAYKEAESHYLKAIKLDNRQHEFYFGLAKVYYKQNRIMAAKISIKKAIQLNNSRSINKQYIAKLNFLKKPEIQIN